MRRTPPALTVPLSEPRPRWRADREVLIRMPGIGGTGVVTVSQILQMAAHLDGWHAAGLDQTGLAQKGGPVVSDIRIGPEPIDGALRATRGTADLLLGFDALGVGAETNLAAAHPDHTVAVVNTAVVPTAAMVTNQVPVPDSARDSVAQLELATRAGDNLYLDTGQLAEDLFGDHMPANMVLVGAAYQHGCLPIAAEAIEQAIRLNGAAVETTLAAFRWGRAAAADPAAVAAALRPEQIVPTVQTVPEIVERVADLGLTGPLAEVLGVRASDLVGYQDARYAEDYLNEVAEVRLRALERVDDSTADVLGIAYAKGLHKLMAYKDEYEVARLHLDPAQRAGLAAQFGDGASVSVLLHPPVLRALGMRRKLRLRRGVDPMFRALRAARRLRGTRADVFGYAGVRRTERELIGEYRALVHAACEHLRPATVDDVVALAELADEIRGYEKIKLANVARFRERARSALTSLAESGATAERSTSRAAG